MVKHPAHVLLVEDEDNIALALEFLIRRQGLEVSRVATGEEALESLELDRPDLVVLDAMLPRTSGFDVCQQIRERPDFSDIKVLMMSAAGDMARQKGLALGADAFFVKPFDTKELCAQIETLLGGGAHA